MLNIRVLAGFAFAVIVACLVSFSDFNAPAQCCPIPPPVPLRELYNRSDCIVVARVGASTVLKTGPGEEATLKTALQVSSTLKGSSQQVIYWEHWVWKKAAWRDGSNGDELLAFLRRNEAGAYEAVDDSHSIKRLPAAALRAYVDRLSELAKMMESGKPDPDALVEWLVRCAEEPATRWEGVYELAKSTPIFDESEGPDVESKDVEQIDGAEEPELNPGEPVEEIEVDDEKNLASTFALLLTEGQQKRLVDALLATEGFEDNESLLLALVSRWNDPRVVPFLVKKLTSEADKPTYCAQQMMGIVADALADRRLESLAAQFSETFQRTIGEEDEQASQAKDEETFERERVDKLKAMLRKFLARVQKKMKDR